MGFLAIEHLHVAKLFVRDRENTHLAILGDDAEKAIAYYDRSIASDANYDEAYAAKAKALARMRKFAEALKAIEKAIEVTNYKPERFVKIREQIQGQDKVGK